MNKLAAGVLSIFLAGSMLPVWTEFPVSNASVPQMVTPEPPEPRETPQVPTDDDLSGTSTSNRSPVVTQIFEVVFSSDTLFDAIDSVFQKASSQEVDQLTSQTNQFNVLFVESLRPPDKGHYASIAAAGLKTAAALGSVLFVIRLALHHWNRLIGEEDSLLDVTGDWVSAGFSAVVAGSILDLLVSLGWWMSFASLGETTVLAREFLNVTAVTDILQNIPGAVRHSLFSTVTAVGGGLAGLLGAVALAFAFAVSQAVLFVLGITSPIAAVIAVLPQMRWLRALWLKAATVLALIPVAAGGIFKATTLLAVSFSGSGYAGMLIRLFWLWGAVGFMLSLAGILGKFSLTAAVETAGKLTRSMQSVLTTALAASGQVSSVAATGGSLSSGMALPSSISTGSGFPAARSSDPLAAQMVSSGFLSQTNLLEKDAGRGYSDLSPYFVSHGLDLERMRGDYSEDMDRLVETFLQDPERIHNAADPLSEAARLSGVSWLAALLSDGDENV